MNKLDQYFDFLQQKFPIAEISGFVIDTDTLHPMLKPHQKELVKWALYGGRRAIFASFGLGKTFIQLEIARKVVEKTGKPFLIGLPLGVRYEFELDAAKLDLQVRYVRDMVEACTAVEEGVMILTCNYERIRNGKMDALFFGGVSFDEASILRSLDTKTVDYIMKEFMQIPYRFVCTATPAPNEYTEILNYAAFLGIMDRSQALTRFFQRDSTKAGHLTLYPHKTKEFWMWFKTWATVLKRPSWMGYSDEGYDMPGMKVIWHKVSIAPVGDIKDRDGNLKLFRDTANNLRDASAEKRNSIADRITKMQDILEASPTDNFLIWHHLEDERRAIEKVLPTANTVYGSQDPDDREKYLIGFGRGDFQYLATKPEIAGSGCNFQRFCHKAIFLGIDYKFNDFIQAIHRIYRFMQMYEVEIHIIYTDAEEDIRKVLEQKWARHIELDEQMEGIIKKYGLYDSTLKTALMMNMGVKRKEVKGKGYTCINNDNVLELLETPDNSVDLDITSIPFGDQYGYVASVHDFGYNYGNSAFFQQMDFLIPEMFRTLKPGRICCIHVKDRIRYSYQTGYGFTSLEDFSGTTRMAFEKHGFVLMAKITITTDVVMENNQTYRLGWSEKCKDKSKMGAGLPEYVLVFRKPPTNNENAFADIPVAEAKDVFVRALWQLLAHGYWRSDGNRLVSSEEIKQMNLSQIGKVWKERCLSDAPYSFEQHLQLCQELEEVGKLSATFMSLPTHSNNPLVWTDVNRMATLNAKQVSKKQEKHVCPMQFDVYDRLIDDYSIPGEIVRDVFGGLMTGNYRSILKGRKGIGIKLNSSCFADGVNYCRDAEALKMVPTLFDVLKEPAA